MMGLSVLKMHLHDMKRKTTTCVSHHLHSVAEKKIRSDIPIVVMINEVPNLNKRRHIFIKLS